MSQISHVSSSKDCISVVDPKRRVMVDIERVHATRPATALMADGNMYTNLIQCVCIPLVQWVKGPLSTVGACIFHVHNNIVPFNTMAGQHIWESEITHDYILCV